ncbi:MAG: hypothetical protein RMI63_06530 [Caldimicrobium sp.]|nr:hypothetical protein [Caldimicrobium sp.]
MYPREKNLLLSYNRCSYLSSRSGRDLWRKFKAVAFFEIRDMKTIMNVNFRGFWEGV